LTDHKHWTADPVSSGNAQVNADRRWWQEL